MSLAGTEQRPFAGGERVIVALEANAGRFAIRVEQRYKIEKGQPLGLHLRWCPEFLSPLYSVISQEQKR